MAKKIMEQQMIKDIKAAVQHFLNEALKAARRNEGEVVLFCLAEAKKIASEIDYDIDDKIEEVLEIAKFWK